MANILSIISVCDRKGGTTVKLKKLVEESAHAHFVYFSIYDQEVAKEYPINRKWFESTKVKVFEGFYGRNIIKHSLEIKKIIKNNNIDIVHFYFNFENTFAPILKILCPKIILIRSIVGYDEPLSKFRSFVLKEVIKPIDHFVHISSYIKNLYEKDYPLIATKQSSIIYNSAIHINDEIISPEKRKYLVSISGLCKRKNLAVLIKAVGIVVKVHKTDCKLFILGDGPSRNEIEKLILELDISENVTLLGYSTKVSEYLNKCSIYVHPANTEGFGIAVAESMYMKCPSIVSNAGALPELIEDGVTGFVVDPYESEEWASKILYLINNKELGIKMGNAAHKRACTIFSQNLFIQNHDFLYDKLLSKTDVNFH